MGRLVASRRRQLGFLLNPARFAAAPAGGLFDDFPGSSIDTGKWAASTVELGYIASASPTYGGTVTVSGGMANLSPTDAANRVVGLSSFNTAIDLVNKSITWDVGAVSGVQSDFLFSVATSAAPGGKFVDFFIQTNGGGSKTVYAFFNNTGSGGTLASVAFSTATRYLRARHTSAGGGDWYWEYSADRVSWSVLRQRSVDAGTPGTHWDPTASDVISHGVFVHNSSSQSGITSSVDAVYIE